jgi:RNA recognition motif-containing protein
MQRELDLDAPIGAPDLDSIQNGGHQIGDRAGESGAREASVAPPQRRKPANGRPGKRGVSAKNGQSVFVGNLAWAATTDDIRDLFGRYGIVNEATIVTDRRDGRSRGFGFVDMAHPAATTAVDALNGTSLHGRDLKVRLARPRATRS